jgi:hypothetical protein
MCNYQFALDPTEKRLFLSLVVNVYRRTLNHAQDQGDQIGQIFAHWAIVFFGQFY